MKSWQSWHNRISNAQFLAENDATSHDFAHSWRKCPDYGLKNHNRDKFSRFWKKWKFVSNRVNSFHSFLNRITFSSQLQHSLLFLNSYSSHFCHQIHIFHQNIKCLLTEMFIVNLPCCQNNVIENCNFVKHNFPSIYSEERLISMTITE